MLILTGITNIWQVLAITGISYHIFAWVCLIKTCHPRWNWGISRCYYMTSSVSGQDEPNLALWLATRACKMEPSCPLRIRALLGKESLSCFVAYSIQKILYLPSLFGKDGWILASFFFLRVYGPRQNLRNQLIFSGDQNSCSIKA